MTNLKSLIGPLGRAYPQITHPAQLQTHTFNKCIPTAILIPENVLNRHCSGSYKWMKQHLEQTGTGKLVALLSIRL